MLSLSKFFNTIYKKPAIAKLHFENFLGRYIYKLAGLDCRIRITVEDEKICLYRKNNSGTLIFEYKGFDQLDRLINVIKENY